MQKQQKQFCYRKEQLPKEALNVILLSLHLISLHFAMVLLTVMTCLSYNALIMCSKPFDNQLVICVS